MKWLTPAGEYLQLYADAARQAHVLVAGQTGSGKSVVINGLIHYLLLSAPGPAELILLDPKRLELYQYKQFPHTLRYAAEPAEMVSALKRAESIMDTRFRAMQANCAKMYSGGNIYIIIDELADLIDTTKEAAPIIARIGRLGRAAKMHLIVATQYLGGTIPPEIKRNLSAVIALHTRTAADSRYLIECKGCESLSIGEALYIRPGRDTPEKCRIPYAGEEAEKAETERLRKWWNDPAHYFIGE